MISFFKNNYPVTIIALVGFTILLWLSAFLDNSYSAFNFSSFMPFYEFVFLQSLKFDTRFIAIALGLILLIAQSLILTRIVDEYEFLGKGTYLPALFYVTLMSCHPDLLTLHPVLFSNLFVLLALQKVMKSHKESDVLKTFFESGLLIASGALFYLPTIMLFPWALLSISILRPFNWREWLSILLGFGTPFYFVAVYYFWNGNLSGFILEKMIYPMLNRKMLVEISIEQLPILLLFGLVLILSAQRLFAGLNKNTVKARKFIYVLIWFFLFAGSSLLIAPSLEITHFTILCVPISLYTVNYFISNRRTWLSEVIYGLILVGIVYAQYFSS